MALEQSDLLGVLPLASVSPRTHPFYLKRTRLLQVRAFGGERLLNLISDPGKVFSMAHHPHYLLVSIITSLISVPGREEAAGTRFFPLFMQGEGQGKQNTQKYSTKVINVFVLLKVSTPNWGWQEFVALGIILLKKQQQNILFKGQILRRIHLEGQYRILQAK